MTAPQIVSVQPVAPVNYLIFYPNRVGFKVTWDQPIYNLNAFVVFECITENTLWGQNQSPQTKPIVPVHLAQTPCRAVQVGVTEVLFSFQVSPFADGALRLSNRPWSPPFFFNIENAWGEKGNWDPFLQFDFSVVTVKGEYLTPTMTSSAILYDDTTNVRGFPKINKAAVCPQGGGTTRPPISLDLNPGYPDGPIATWEGGRFWQWYNIGAERLLATTVPSYYETDYQGNPNLGPYFYMWSENTVPVTRAKPPNPPEDTDPTKDYPWWNINTNDQEAIYSTCPWMTNYYPAPPDPNAQPVFWNGRLESWIYSADPYYENDPPDEWINQKANTINKFNLAPWALATKTSPMYIQLYTFCPWMYYILNPPSR